MIHATLDATRRALATRGAPFEYWYLKVNAGDLAFLVDFIVRRTTGRAEIRLSYWVRRAAHIVHETHERWEADGPAVRVGEATFDDGATRGTSSGMVRSNARQARSWPRMSMTACAIVPTGASPSISPLATAATPAQPPKYAERSIIGARAGWIRRAPKE